MDNNTRTKLGEFDFEPLAQNLPTENSSTSDNTNSEETVASDDNLETTYTPQSEFVTQTQEPNSNNYSRPNSELKSTIENNKQQLQKNEQIRLNKLQLRGIQIQQNQRNLQLQQAKKRKAPKTSLLKKGVLAGAFSLATAGSGVTLFQLLFT
jgi:hypothetical protein